jgi:hypothetical protein
VEDINLYIESGILELYILGDVTHDEKLQVEEMSLKHPAIKAELDAIGRSVELYAFENSVEPADHLRERILNSLLTNFGDDNISPSKTEKAEAKVISLPAPKKNSFYKYAFAACLALLLLSVAALIDIYSKLQDANTQLVALNSTNQLFTKTVNFQDQQLNVYRDTTFRFIKLKGTIHAPNASLLLAFNPIKRKVMIAMADLKMPQNDKGHQYQLWALVGGKPVDLGVFDKNASDSVDMKEMKSIALAQAFAVTLEPRGGSVNPTMDQMMVIGNF